MVVKKESKKNILQHCNISFIPINIKFPTKFCTVLTHPQFQFRLNCEKQKQKGKCKRKGQS